MLTPEEIRRFADLPTPFYYYQLDLLRLTLDRAQHAARQYDYKLHYAFKANSNDRILQLIREKGFGADCVSGNEVRKAIEIGFMPSQVVFAGVGKSDAEIRYALAQDIFCFNVESLQELEVMASLAAVAERKARIALRINPNVDAYTHHYITTGLHENKFGIQTAHLSEVCELLRRSTWLELTGIHLHIGSQITSGEPFRALCEKINELQNWFEAQGFSLSHINAGGGLGIDYRQPDQHPVPDFETYFSIFHRHLALRPGQELHFEPGRSLVGQCGSLITRVLYLKKGLKTDFVIADAGMTELIRPALYQSYHRVENLSARLEPRAEGFLYDVVGPVCESSDCFGKGMELPETRRGDLLAIRSAGAYGEVMASRYNLREMAAAVFSE